MSHTLALILSLTLTSFARADVPAPRPAGAQICAGELCYPRLALGEAGLDLRGQVSRFETEFNDDLRPKADGGGLTHGKIAGVAGALALAPRARAALTTAFRDLRLTELGFKLPEFSETNSAEKRTPVEVGFLARFAWTDATGAGGISLVRGHLAFPENLEIDAGKPAAELNELISSLIKVDAIEGGGVTDAQVVDFVGPAVLGDLIVALLMPIDHLGGTALETVGRALQADARPAR